MDGIRVFVLIIMFSYLSFSCKKSRIADLDKPVKGFILLSNHRANNLRKLDSAVSWGINHIELSHYQLCHFLKDMRDSICRSDVNFLANEAVKRGIKEIFVWDHAFYEMDYYPDRFKVPADSSAVFFHHTQRFAGGMEMQLNLDDPGFWNWVYNDYDSLLALVPDINGIVLTFIETGSYVIYQHSLKATTPEEKIAMLVDSLAEYFVDRKGLQLTIRTFIYNRFEKDGMVKALSLIKHKNIRVMIKMVPHDWFLTYPYEDYVADILFPVVIEYDGGMEYCGENIIANSFPRYFDDGFNYYHQFPNVVGFCARTDRYGETSAMYSR